MGNYTTKKQLKQEPITYSVQDIADMLRIGRTMAYQLTQEGHFKVMRIGRIIRISKQSFDEWFEQLQNE